MYQHLLQLHGDKMAPKRQRVPKETSIFEPSDRISHLPAEVLDEILKRIPIREVVKTSLLSTSWRNRWTYMTQLVFGVKSHPLDCSELLRHNKLVKFVNYFLLRHSADTVRHFALNEFLNPCYDIDQWILLLSKKNVRNLDLIFGMDCYDVPASLFACETLRSLKLQGCIVRRFPSQFKELIHLTYLRLYRVQLTNEVLDSLLCKLPALFNLKVHFCETLTQFRFNSPSKVKYFSFYGVCQSINLRNAPNLVFLSFRPWVSPRDPLALSGRVDEILQGLYALRHIVIAHPTAELSSVGTAPERFSITFHNLVYMELYVDFNDPKQIVAVLCLCRSSPRLRRLTITDAYDTEPVLPYDDNFWDKQILVKRDVFCCLKSVRIIGFKGSQNQRGFAGFILSKAAMIERFCFKWSVSCRITTQVKKSVIHELLQFKKSSAISRIISLKDRGHSYILHF